VFAKPPNAGYKLVGGENSSSIKRAKSCANYFAVLSAMHTGLPDVKPSLLNHPSHSDVIEVAVKGDPRNSPPPPEGARPTFDDTHEPAVVTMSQKRRRRRSPKRSHSPSDITASAESVAFDKLFDYSEALPSSGSSPSTEQSPVFAFMLRAAPEKSHQGKYPALDKISSHNVSLLKLT
jgi:hypothetical protein